MHLSYEDGETLRLLQRQFEDSDAKSLFQFVLDNAPESLSAKLVNADGDPSTTKARKAVQALTVTTVAKVCLRPSPAVVRDYMEPNFTAVRYAQNFVNGTNRTLSSWNYLPEEVRREFVALYAARSWDDPFDERVDDIVRSATLLVEHFQKNPYEAKVAALESELAEQIAAYEALLRAHEEGGKKGRRPKRPATMARELKKLRSKAKKWAHRPDLDAKKVGRFVRLHDQMRMLSEWEGSSTGRKPKTPRSYRYNPLELVYPGASTDEGDSFGWNALLCCCLDERNLGRVVATGERLDLIKGAYSMCRTRGVERFTRANDLYLKYLSAKKQGKRARKAGPPQIKSGCHSFGVQQVSVEHGGPPSLEEGLSADGRRWEVRCNACSDCGAGEICHGYYPRVVLGGMAMALGEEIASRGIRISRAEYRRVRKISAHGGRVSEAIVSREKVTDGLGKPELRGRAGPRRACPDRNGRHFVSLVISDIPSPSPPPLRKVDPDRVVGIDPGARKFLTLSNHRVFPDLQVALKPHVRERENLQRRLSRWHDRRCPDKWRGRKYEAIRRRYSEACDRVARMRRHMHEQIITEILEMPFDVIALEDTSVSNMTRSAKGTEDLPAAYGQAKASRVRNRMMLAQGIGNFRLRLLQRAKKAGKIVVLVASAGTSQTCNACKARHAGLGSDEIFLCPSCGHREDRDRNASLNIRDEAVALLEKHGPAPVGGRYLCTEDLG